MEEKIHFMAIVEVVLCGDKWLGWGKGLTGGWWVEGNYVLNYSGDFALGI